MDNSDTQEMALTVSEPGFTTLSPNPMSIAELKTHVVNVQDVMRSVMVNGKDYGTIPGCGDKPTLLKPGAEKLKLAFKLSDRIDVEDLGSLVGEAHYRVTVLLTHAPSDTFVGSGIGECSSQETKYAWRAAVNAEEWDATPETHRRIKYSRHQNVNQIRTQPDDVRNTVLKMAKKRAFVDAVLSCTAASDVFTQDVDETADRNGPHDAARQPQRKVGAKVGAGTRGPQRKPESRQADDGPEPRYGRITGEITEYIVPNTPGSPHRITIDSKALGSQSFTFFEVPGLIKSEEPNAVIGKQVRCEFVTKVVRGNVYNNLTGMVQQNESQPSLLKSGDASVPDDDFTKQCFSIASQDVIDGVLENFGYATCAAIPTERREEMVATLRRQH